MAKVKVTERIYVDQKGKPVGAEFKGPKVLAARPGDLVDEKRAAELGVKAAPQAENKAAPQADSKEEQPAENKGRTIFGKKS